MDDLFVAPSVSSRHDLPTQAEDSRRITILWGAEGATQTYQFRVNTGKWLLYQGGPTAAIGSTLSLPTLGKPTFL